MPWVFLAIFAAPVLRMLDLELLVTRRRIYLKEERHAVERWQRVPYQNLSGGQGRGSCTSDAALPGLA